MVTVRQNSLLFFNKWYGSAILCRIFVVAVVVVFIPETDPVFLFNKWQ